MEASGSDLLGSSTTRVVRMAVRRFKLDSPLALGVLPPAKLESLDERVPVRRISASYSSHLRPKVRTRRSSPSGLFAPLRVWIGQKE
jgi:hypothetical protein